MNIDGISFISICMFFVFFKNVIIFVNPVFVQVLKEKSWNMWNNLKIVSTEIFRIYLLIA